MFVLYSNICFSLFLCSVSGSHSLGLIIAYIKGETPFSEFSFTVLLDDITVGHFDSEKKMYFSRGLSDVEEDDGVVDPNQARSMSSLMHSDLDERWLYVKHVLNQTEHIHVQQRLVMCELMENDMPGPMITKNKTLLDLALWHYGNLFYPECIKTLRGFLKKRSNQVKRKVKPRVRIIQRRRSVSGWDGVTCLATGFYPRHINLTILRDDGTYQMRKNLEFSEKDLKKHNYTCTVTHLSLDNKLNVLLDLGPGDPIVPIVGSVLAALLLVCVMSAVIWVIYRKKMKGKR
uniref:Major histocompatibility complex class I LGA n=1 Tax=Astyanax mexicanus TaxID=7994 RepID=A0A8B9KVL2_ASTMX